MSQNSQVKDLIQNQAIFLIRILRKQILNESPLLSNLVDVRGCDTGFVLTFDKVQYRVSPEALSEVEKFIVGLDPEHNSVDSRNPKIVTYDFVQYETEVNDRILRQILSITLNYEKGTVSLSISIVALPKL